jgi:hypothetical protein
MNETGAVKDQLRRRRRRFSSKKRRQRIIALFGIFALLSVLAFVFKEPLKRLWLASETSDHVESARTLMNHGEWEPAAALLSEALRIAPDDAEVLRTFADLLKRANANPADRAQFLQRLADRGFATSADLIALADAHQSRGDVSAARRVLDTLPSAERQSAEALHVEAAMLKLEGRGAHAETMLRSALEVQTVQEPAARFKLAVLDFKQSRPAIHQRGAELLWQHARAGDAHADDAIRLIAAEPDLSAASARELASLAEKRPDTVRQAVLTRLLRLQPVESDRLILQEYERASADGEAGQLSFARWLAKIGEHDRLVKYLPDETLLKAQDLPPELLRAKLAALGRLGRWEQIRQIMTPEVEKHLGPVVYHLWIARLHALAPDGFDHARQHLTIAMNTAGQGADTSAALEAASVAVKMQDWPLAASLCRSAAEHVTTTTARVALLERVLQFHAEAGDCGVMSATAKEIAALTPGNQAHAFRADYLMLLAGEAMELIAAHYGSSNQPQDTARTSLMRAFSAYRLGMPIEKKSLLPVLPAAQTWPPGPRAVLAGLLAYGGESAKAFQLAEGIQRLSLLPEEQKLLNRAK